MKKPALIITTLIFAILVLSIVRISVSNRISTSGIAIAGIEDQASTYKKENLVLQEQLLSISSYTEIASKAATIGFAPSKTNLVISSALPVAIR